MRTEERRAGKRFAVGEVKLPGAALAGMLLCVLLATSGSALAHAKLLKSVPAQRAVLAQSPARLQLWFSERLEARFSSFSVLDANARPVELGPVAVDHDDPKSLSADLKALPQGRYTVKYRVLSTDGHVVASEFPFTIAK